jgi:N-acetyl-gamma-glutamyl-phosphate reductase
MALRVGIVGATGYGGAELVRLLAIHPKADLVLATSSRSAGKAIREECPWLASNLRLTEFDPERVDVDVLFLAQESGFALEHAGALIERTRVVDLSADFRLTDLEAFERFYKKKHPGSPAFPDVVYGLPELVDHDQIRKAKLVANPGCHVTASLLALMPLAPYLTGTPVLDSKTGASGAGRSRKETEYLFSELDGGVRAYAEVGHRHTPEIEMILGRKVRFTPHLVPMARGLEVTLHAPIEGTPADLCGIYQAFSNGKPFVNIVDRSPSTKQVLGSNRCDVFATYDEHTGFAVVTSVIDNLVKGAAGQAIQNMNIMFDFPEGTGLPIHGVWP